MLPRLDIESKTITAKHVVCETTNTTFCCLHKLSRSRFARVDQNHKQILRLFHDQYHSMLFGKTEKKERNKLGLYRPSSDTKLELVKFQIEF